MYTYYHITPTRNVPRILRRGLLPAYAHGAGLSSLVGESVVGKLFVTSDPEAARDIVSFNFAGRWGDIPDWTILRVRTSERGEIDPDFGFEGYYYLTKPILPKNIDVFMEFEEEEGNIVPGGSYEDTLRLFYSREED